MTDKPSSQQHEPHTRITQLLRNRQFAEALEAVTTALGSEPLDPHLHAFRALCLFAQERYEDTLAEIEVALPLQQDDKQRAVLWGVQGGAFVGLNRNDEALPVLDRAIAVLPHLNDTLLYRGMALRRLGKPAEALPVLDRSIELYTAANHPATDALLERADALTDLQRHEDAIAAYDQALHTNLALLGAWVGKAGALELLGKPHEALEAYDQALMHGDQLWKTQFRRVRLLVGLRRYDAALTANEQALARATAPQDVAAAQAQRAELLRRMGRRAEARELSAAAVAADPTSKYVWSARVRVLIRTGHLIQAARALREYIQRFGVGTQSG